jgi:hypothetical protein
MCGWAMSAVSSYIPIAVSKVLVVILKSRGSTSCNFCSLLIKSSYIVLLLKNSGCSLSLSMYSVVIAAIPPVFNTLSISFKHLKAPE